MKNWEENAAPILVVLVMFIGVGSFLGYLMLIDIRIAEHNKEMLAHPGHSPVVIENILFGEATLWGCETEELKGNLLAGGGEITLTRNKYTFSHKKGRTYYFERIAGYDYVPGNTQYIKIKMY